MSIAQTKWYFRDLISYFRHC